MKRAFHVVDQDEQGVTILVVACSLAFVMIALAALVIDVSALFTARGDAKQAADTAALAGAKVLANSGMTSDPTNATLQANAVALATQVATAVATKNTVGGRPLTIGEVTVSFPNIGGLTFESNPQIKVAVQRTDLPTFFARAWGTKIVPVGATATAEAVNPSPTGGTPGFPIAPHCVKPWILPNSAPLAGTPPIFDAAGTPVAGLVGVRVTLIPGCPATVACVNPTVDMSKTPPEMPYYYEQQLAQPSASSLPSCTTSTCDYEQNIAACDPNPIRCNQPRTQISLVGAPSCGGNPDRQTSRGTRCLIHATGTGPGGQGQDCISVNGNAATYCSAGASTLDTQLFAGSENPLVQSGTINLGDPISSSDSVVTMPVYASVPATAPTSDRTSTTAVFVDVIGFLQGFITGVERGTGGPPALRGRIYMTIVNVSGCGATLSGPTIVGDGISPVPVRLIKQ
jgi:Flp pilus assembly protein TadG